MVAVISSTATFTCPNVLFHTNFDSCSIGNSPSDFFAEFPYPCPNGTPTTGDDGTFSCAGDLLKIDSSVFHKGCGHVHLFGIINNATTFVGPNDVTFNYLMSCEQKNPQLLFGGNHTLVPVALGDIAAGTITATNIDLVPGSAGYPSAISLDIQCAGPNVYASHSRLPIVTALTGAFLESHLIYTRPNSVLVPFFATIKYSPSTNTATWYINGIKKLEISNVGQRQPTLAADRIIDYGGPNIASVPTAFLHALGSIDFQDRCLQGTCSNVATAKNLMNIEANPYAFNSANNALPATFQVTNPRADLTDNLDGNGVLGYVKFFNVIELAPCSFPGF